MAITGRIDEATDAAAELQAQGLIAYGFGPPPTISATAHVAPAPQSVQVFPTVANAAPAPQEVQIPQNAAKGAKSKTHTRSFVSSASTEPVAPSKKPAVALAPGSDIRSPTIHLCQEGRVVYWGSFYNTGTLATKWPETNPAIPWQGRIVSLLLCRGKKDDIFTSWTPSDLPAVTTKALHTFWSSGAPSLAAKEGKPSDFP